MADVIMDAWLDSLKLLPFLFITYFLMEYIEHKMGEHSKRSIERSGRLGPFIGGLIGVFPQCGFSAAASNLYAGGVITLGTLIAVFLSTSDEMLPILLSEQAAAAVILKLLALKALIGITAGLVTDMVVRKKSSSVKEELKASDSVCRHEPCGCEKGIVLPAVRHTFQIFIFITVISMALNGVIFLAGENFLAGLLLNRPVLGPVIAGFVGLIPNCASSVLLTQLYLEGLMSLGAMMAGLLAGTGVGLLVLFKVNASVKENLRILALLYVIGVFAGIVLDALKIVM